MHFIEKGLKEYLFGILLAGVVNPLVNYLHEISVEGEVRLLHTFP